MQLTVLDVARILKVSEQTVYRWVSDHDLPAEQVNGQYRFNKAVLLEWAALRKMTIPSWFFQSLGNGTTPPRLDEALQHGGIFHGIAGPDKKSVLGAVVQAMPLPDAYHREILFQVLLSRESLGATALGEGLAIPHPRYPVVLPIPLPFITLCFLEKPIPYGGAANQLVHTLFALVSPTVPLHLRLLARLSSALSDAAFAEVIRRQASPEEILSQARHLEDILVDPRGEPSQEAGK